MTDPLVVQGYRHVRVDVWAHALCFAFLLFVNRFACSGSVWALFAGGSLAATMLFVWPSSFLLLPLLAWGSWNALRARGEVGGSAPCYWRLVGALVLGAAAGTLLLLLPIVAQLPRMATGFHHMSGGALNYGGDFFSALRWSPFLPLAACAALVVARDRALWLASALAIGLVLLTSPYVHRVAYLVPTMIVAIAAIYTRAAANGSAPPSWLRPALAVVVAWSTFVSLGARSFVALAESTLRDPDNAMIAARVLGPGRHRVLTKTPQLYYAGRRHGWRMYGPVLYGGDAGLAVRGESAL